MLDLSRCKWVYLQHPSGRVHALNANESNLIKMLLAQDWLRVEKPAFEDKTIIHRERSKNIR